MITRKYIHLFATGLLLLTGAGCRKDFLDTKIDLAQTQELLNTNFSTLLSFAEATSTATLHPYAPLLAVSVGERRYPLLSLDDEAEEGVEGAAGEGGAQRHANGLTIWQLGVGDQRGGGGRTASAVHALAVCD